MSIDFAKFDSEYVTLQPDFPVKLKLSNWQEYVWLNSLGLKFDAVVEDGTKKKFSTLSKRLIRQLIPIIKKAELMGKGYITVIIEKSGAGLDTRFSVKEVEDE